MKAKRLICTLSSLFIVAILAIPATSNAAAIVLGPQNAVTGITGLFFTDGTYNYSADAYFIAGLYGKVYSSPPTFLNNAQGAQSASIAIANALNVYGATNIAGLTPSVNPAEEYLSIPYRLYTSNGLQNADNYGVTMTHPATWEPSGGSQAIAYSPPTYWGNVVFSNVSVAPVPVPAAAWLFASGVLGLTRLSRKSKAA